jgi:paraquat-inducible protein B
MAKISALPLDDLITSATAAMGGIKNVTESPEVRETIRRADGLMADLREFVREARPMLTSFIATSDTARGTVTQVGQDLRSLAASLERTSEAAKGVLTDGQQLVRDVDAKVGPLASSFTAAMERAEGVLGGVNGTLTARSGLGYQFSQALEQLTAAARSIRTLADYLDQHPESLLAGKGEARRR